MCSEAPGTSEKELLKNAPDASQTQKNVNFKRLRSTLFLSSPQDQANPEKLGYMIEFSKIYDFAVTGV